MTRDFLCWKLYWCYSDLCVFSTQSPVCIFMCHNVLILDFGIFHLNTKNLGRAAPRQRPLTMCESSGKVLSAAVWQKALKSALASPVTRSESARIERYGTP